MSRNGSGTYSFPSNSFNPAVDDTVIDSSDWNDVVSDLETAISASIASDGQTVTTASIPFAQGLSVAGADLLVGNGIRVVIGHTGQITAGQASELQVLGSAIADASGIIGIFSADAVGPAQSFVKSRHATVGSNTIVQDNDVVGRLDYYPADGVDFDTLAASFFAEVDDASPAAGDVGMAFVWQSMPGAAGAIQEVMRIAATGELQLAKGQINFPDTQNASSDANTLDDYEEGTWTPTYTTDGTDFDSITYDVTTGGRYIKVGSEVSIGGRLMTDSITVGSASGNLQIGGLPFAAVAHTGSTNDADSGLGLGYSAAFTTNPTTMFVRGGESVISLYTRSAAAGDSAVVAYTGLATSTNDNLLIFGGRYQAAS